MSNTPLFDCVVDYQNLKRSYKQTQLWHRKYRSAAIIFDMARERNLVSIWKALRDGSYRPGSYIHFSVTEPKTRKISAPRIRDKIVQFSCHLVLKDIYAPVLIKDTFACLEERGTHRAVTALQHHMRQCKWECGDGWIVKMDIRKFFYSIDRQILKRLLRKKISDEKFLALLDIIIDSSPEGEVGIPLGNVTSQDFANIYLNEIDQYCKRYLGLKHYVRYMDDMIVMVPTREEAKSVLENVRRFAKERLNLELNEKSQIFPLAQGVNAYGFKVWTTHRMVRNSSKAAMKRRIKAMDAKVKAGKIKEKDVQRSVDSWLGHARHSNSYNLCKKIFRRYPYIKVDSPKYRFGSIEQPH